MSKVVLINCESYDYVNVKKAVQKGIELLGGPEVFAKANEKILLKPNWLAADPPEKQTSTHPMVFKAVVEALKSTKAKFFYGDSPGFHAPVVAAKKCGFEEIAKELNVTLADFNSGKEIFLRMAFKIKNLLLLMVYLKAMD